jgi:hypothetical protein
MFIDGRQTDPPLRREKERVCSMFRPLLKPKIYRVAVTDCELHFEGSCAIDENLLDAAKPAQE